MIFHRHHPHSFGMRSTHPVTRLFLHKNIAYAGIDCKHRFFQFSYFISHSSLNTDITVRLSDKITLHCVGKYVEIDLYDYTISDNIIIPAEYIPLGRPVTEIAVIHAGPDRLTTGRMLINGINFVFYNSDWTNITHEQGYYVRGSVSYIRASGI